MDVQTLNHGDTIECYGVDYEVVLILGIQVTIRNTVPDKKGKQATITTNLSVILEQIADGHYKLKQKVDQYASINRKGT